MSKSGLNKYQDELLEILAEECGELVQEKSKIFRFGFTEPSCHIEGFTHQQCLEQEIGDLLAMIELLVDSEMGITYNGIEAAKQRKLQKVGKWMTHKKPTKLHKVGSIENVMDMALQRAKKDLNNYKDKT